MANAVVSESALRELLKEALDNDGAMSHDAAAPVTPNAVVDRTSMELDFDPIEVKALPRTKNELIIMVRNLLDAVDDDQSGELYKKIKNLVGGDEAGVKDYGKARELPPNVNPVDRSATAMKKVDETKELVEAVRKIVAESVEETVEEAPVRIDPEQTGDIHYRHDTPQARRNAAAANVRWARRAAQGTTSASGTEGPHVGAQRRASPDAPWVAATDVATSDTDQKRMADLSTKIGLPKSAAKYAKRADALSGYEKPMESKLASVIRDIVEETLSEALPFGFGKGKMGLGGEFRHPNDEEEGPEDDFRARGGSVDDEFNTKGEPLWDPNEDITDPEELDAVLAKMTKSAWDPDEDEEEEKPTAKGSPKKRVDLGTGYGVEGDTFEKMGEKMGVTPEAAKKAVAVAAERFKVLHDMDPEELKEFVQDGFDEYMTLLRKSGELTPEEIKFMYDNEDKVVEGESFREFFNKFVKRAVRELRADTQDDEDE